MARVTLTGGPFQDAEGNVLANGYLTMELTSDEQVITATAQVCKGIVLTISLDGSGNIAASQSIWPNDQLFPLGSAYIVKAYTALGQLAWGPQVETVTGASPFNVNSWVPNGTPISAPTGPILLQTNGVNNGAQGKLNLVPGSGISLADDGIGDVTITNTLQLKTNGVANGSQTLLNLKNGTAVTIADDGVGGVTVNGFSPTNPSNFYLVNDYSFFGGGSSMFYPLPVTGEMWRAGNSGNYSPPSTATYYGPPHIGIMPIITAAASAFSTVNMNLKGMSLSQGSSSGEFHVTMGDTSAPWSLNFIFNVLSPITAMLALFGLFNLMGSGGNPFVPIDGIGLFYDSTVNSHWLISSWANGSRTDLYTSSVTVAAGWNNLLLQGGTANAINWTLNGTFLTTTSATNAFTSNNMSPGLCLMTRDTTAKAIDLDYWSFGYTGLNR